MGIENTIVAGATQADIKRGCVMALDFRDREQLRRIGATVYGDPVVHFGVEGNSTDVSVVLKISGLVFDQPELTLQFEYYPQSASDGPLEHLIDLYIVGKRLVIFRTSSKLYVRVDTTDIFSETVGGGSWDVGKKSMITICLKSGDSALYINETISVTSTDTFTLGKLVDLVVGSRYTGTGFFNGILKYMKVFHATLTEREHIDTYEQTTYSYMQDATVNLPMTEDWYNSGSGLALDASGKGNDGTLVSCVKHNKAGFILDGSTSAITGLPALTGDFTVSICSDHTVNHYNTDTVYESIRTIGGFAGLLQKLTVNSSLLTHTQKYDLEMEMLSGLGTVDSREAITESGSTLTPRANIEIDPSEPGLIWGSNMRPTGNKIVDLSSGGNDGTIVGGMHGQDALGDYLTSDGSATVTVGNVGTIKSVSSWINISTTTEDIFYFDGGTHTVEATAGTLSATGFTTPSIFIDGVETTTITSGLHHILISTSTGFAASAFVCALQTGKTYSTKLNSEEKTIDYAKREYNKGAVAL